MDVFAVTLHIHQIFARYDWKIIDGENSIVNLLFDDISLGRSFDRHFSVRCIDNSDSGICVRCLNIKT